MHTAALVALGLVLFVITFAVLGLARLMLRRQGGQV
jgi:phosphate transport system permease protein